MNETSTSAPAGYFVVSPLKFTLMSICTIGFYVIYWGYRNWRHIRDRDQRNIWPFWRALFGEITYYWLLSDIAEQARSVWLDKTYIRALLAVLVLCLAFTSSLPEPWWLISLFSFVPMLPAVVATATANNREGLTSDGAGHRPLNFFAYLVGGPLVLALVLTTIGWLPGISLPSTQVIEGTALRAADIAYLREAEILGEDEEILYFYSNAAWSIEDDGQFISYDYITSYWQDPEDGKTYTSFASYEEIADIVVEQSSSPLENTVVTIKLKDGEEFILWLSAEDGGDARFIKTMRRIWYLAQAEAEASPEADADCDPTTASTTGDTDPCSVQETTAP